MSEHELVHELVEADRNHRDEQHQIGFNVWDNILKADPLEVHNPVDEGPKDEMRDQHTRCVDGGVNVDVVLGFDKKKDGHYCGELYDRIPDRGNPELLDAKKEPVHIQPRRRHIHEHDQADGPILAQKERIAAVQNHHRGCRHQLKRVDGRKCV